MTTARGAMAARAAAWVAAAATTASATTALLTWLNVGAEAVLVPPAVVATLLTAVGLMTTGYGFSLARSAPGAAVSVGPLVLLTVVAAVDGVIASMGIFVLASSVGAQNASTVSIIVVLLGLTITICGLRMIRIMRTRAGLPSPPTGSD